MAVAKKTTTLSLKPTAKSAVDGGETKKADVTPKAETTTPPEPSCYPSRTRCGGPSSEKI